EPNCIPEMLKQLELEPKANIDEYFVDIEKPECLLKDPDGRKVSNVGTQVKVKVSPGVGVGESEQEEIFKDMDDGSYTVTYVVPKRGNYMLSVECDGTTTYRVGSTNELPAPMAPYADAMAAAQAIVAAPFYMYYFCCCLGDR
ncbi:filamin/ABP280 repeat-containing protein, partial [Tanacetum coccineum]